MQGIVTFKMMCDAIDKIRVELKEFKSEINTRLLELETSKSPTAINLVGKSVDISVDKKEVK